MQGRKQEKHQQDPLSLKAISEGIKELLESKAPTSAQFGSLANSFIALYRQNLLRPMLAGFSTNPDDSTKEMEKRLNIFVDSLQGREQVGLTIAKHRLACCLKGKPVTIESLDSVIKEFVIRRLVSFGGLQHEGKGIGFGTVDGVLVALDIWLSKISTSNSIDEILKILELLEVFDKQVFIEKKVAFIPVANPSEENGKLGKRTLDSYSVITADQLVSACKSKIDAIVVAALKAVKQSAEDTTKLLRALSAPILQLMSNPLLVSEFAQKLLENDDHTLQDAALGLIVNLISKYSFEFPTYYERLYNLVRSRQTFSLQLLKIIEISLKSKKLSVKVLAAFMKVALQLCVSFS